MYIESFEFPGNAREEAFLQNDYRLKQTCYPSVYPFQVFEKRRLDTLYFAPITVLYGGNGSGKSTILNVIAEKLKLQRGTYFNRSPFFQDYVDMCEYYQPLYSPKIPEGSRMITSDDVFDYMLEVRAANEGIAVRREELLQEYLEEKNAKVQFQSMEDYERFKKNRSAKRLTASKYVKERLMKDIPERSNGESAFRYFTEQITEKALYLLDEPENSMAVGLQQELQRFLEDSARFYQCQFIIATHSPFLLSMKGAAIYDLDRDEIEKRPWTELENVRAYFDFFMKHRKEFEN